jgi:sugar phosphate isomerase/epimerase
MTNRAAMRIGNQTAKAAADPFGPFHFALEQQFEAFEWFADREGDRGFDFGLLHEPGREALRHRGHEADMRFSVHAAWRADPRNGDGKAPLHEAIDFAGAIDAPIVVFHLAAEAEAEPFAAALEPMIGHAVEAKTCLALENTPATTPEQFNALFARLAADPRAAEHVGMCFDLGHANLHPTTHNDYLAYFDRLAPSVPVVHLHVHENFGDHDAHLPIGTGPAGEDPAALRGLIGRLMQRDYAGSLIMEQWPEPADMLCEARRWLQTQITRVEQQAEPADAESTST